MKSAIILTLLVLSLAFSGCIGGGSDAVSSTTTTVSDIVSAAAPSFDELDSLVVSDGDEISVQGHIEIVPYGFDRPTRFEFVVDSEEVSLAPKQG